MRNKKAGWFVMISLLGLNAYIWPTLISDIKEAKNMSQRFDTSNQVKTEGASTAAIALNDSMGNPSESSKHKPSTAVNSKSVASQASAPAPIQTGSSKKPIVAANTTSSKQVVQPQRNSSSYTAGQQVPASKQQEKQISNQKVESQGSSLNKGNKSVNPVSNVKDGDQKVMNPVVNKPIQPPTQSEQVPITPKNPTIVVDQAKVEKPVDHVSNNNATGSKDKDEPKDQQTVDFSDSWQSEWENGKN